MAFDWELQKTPPPIKSTFCISTFITKFSSENPITQLYASVTIVLACIKYENNKCICSECAELKQHLCMELQ